MKKNLLKTALAAFVMALGTTGAWGQTQITSTLYSQNFDDLTGVPSDWTQANGSLTLEANGSNKYLKETTSGSGSRTAWYNGTAIAEAVKNFDNWTIEFDCLIAEGTNTSNYSQGVWLLGSKRSSKDFSSGTPTSPIIGVKKGTKQSVYTVSVAATETSTTVNLTSNTYYHYIVSYDKTNTKLSFTIQNADKTEDVLSKTEFDYDASTTTMGNLEGIAMQAGRGTKDNTNGFTCIDNIVITTVSSKEIVTAPQANITAINGVERTVAITAQDATHKLYYYFGDDSTNPTEYSAPITVSETSTLHYYAQSTSGAKSDVQTLEVNCVAVTLSKPSILRTGANSYQITATQDATDGITPVPTIHYTISGGTESTAANGATINNVDGDIVAWAEATGFTNSETTTATYVAAYAYYDVWSYNVNSFPSTYSITSIAEAIDKDTKATINGNENMYNLKNINMKDLYVENSTGWLLRNQSASAFKCQYAKVSIAVNNVTTDDIICLALNRDGGGNAVSSVTNGKVAYNYNYQEYFIVPDADGAVTVTLGTGVALNAVTVGKTSVTKNITSTKLASFSAASNTVVPEGVSVYTAKVSGDNVVLTKVETSVIPANTGVIVKSDAEGDKTFKVTVDGTEASFEGNELIATSVAANATVPSEGTYYALSASEATFGVLKGGITLSSNKAYIKAPVAASDANTVLSIKFGDDTTGINAAKVKTAEADGAYYTLQGVKTMKPAKGLYIHNGKKVIVK